MELLSLLQKDFTFVSAMSEKYPTFHIPSWYARLPSMSASHFESIRCELSKQRGHYQGIGLIGPYSYSYVVPLSDGMLSESALITFNDIEVTITHEVSVSTLFDELEHYISMNHKL